MNTDPSLETVRIGIVSISDRASSGTYEDKGLPALREWLQQALHNPLEFEPRLIPDEQALISQTLIDLVQAGCPLVLTTVTFSGKKAAETATAASSKPPGSLRKSSTRPLSCGSC